MVHPEIRDSIPHEKVQPAEVGSHIVQSAAGQEQTQITQNDQLRVPGLVQGAAGIEMVDTTGKAVLLALAPSLGLASVVVVTGDIDGEIHGPAEQLLEKQGAGRQNWGLLHQLAQLVHSSADARSIVLPGLGNEDHITGHVAGSFVVLSVGDLPREVRDQQERVAEPADGVIQDLGRRECLVTALVSQNPQTGCDEALNNGVDSPQTRSHRHGGHVLRRHIIVEEVEDSGQNGQVPEHIVQALSGRAMEAVGRDGIPNLLDGEVGKLELVPVGVEHLAAVSLGIRRHRGQ